MVAHPHDWVFDYGNTADTPNARFDHIKPHVQGADVLDLGVVQHDVEKSTQKRWLHDLIRTEAEVCHGLDIDESGISELKKRGYDVSVGNAENLNLDRRYDVIVAGELIEHLTNVGDFLVSSKEHLKDGGKLILTTPNPFFWRRIIRIIAKGDKPVNPEHTCWFDNVTLKQVLDRCGFDMEELHFTSEEWLYRNLPVPREQFRHTGMVAIATPR